MRQLCCLRSLYLGARRGLTSQKLCDTLRRAKLGAHGWDRRLSGRALWAGRSLPATEDCATAALVRRAGAGGLAEAGKLRWQGERKLALPLWPNGGTVSVSTEGRILKHLKDRGQGHGTSGGSCRTSSGGPRAIG